MARCDRGREGEKLVVAECRSRKLRMVELSIIRGISVRILFSVERIVMIIRNIFWMYTMRGFWFKIWIRIRVLNTKRILEFQ